MTGHRRRAIFHLEAIVSLCIVVFLLGAFAAAVLSLARTSHALISRQQATLAAEAVLNQLRDGRPPTDEALADRFRDMEIQIEREDATGDFEGLDRVTVIVEAFTQGRRTASVRLSGVVEPEAAR